MAQPDSQPPTGAQTNSLNHPRESARHTRPWLKKRGKPLAEDFARTAIRLTKEFSDVQEEFDTLTSTTQVGHFSGIVAMDTTGWLLAARTDGLLSR
jgi:hypothetical protein